MAKKDNRSNHSRPAAGVLPARAQWIVYDPVSQHSADSRWRPRRRLAEYVDMVENQVQQIDTLDSQLRRVQGTTSSLQQSRPKLIVLSMVAPLDTDLKNLEPEVNLENLVADADGNIALNFNDLRHLRHSGRQLPDAARPDRHPAAQSTNTNQFAAMPSIPRATFNRGCQNNAAPSNGSSTLKDRNRRRTTEQLQNARRRMPRFKELRLASSRV